MGCIVPQNDIPRKGVSFEKQVLSYLAGIPKTLATDFTDLRGLSKKISGNP